MSSQKRNLKKSNKEHRQYVKIIRTKPNNEFKKEDKLDIKMMKTEPDMNKITYMGEKVALVLGMASIFTLYRAIQMISFLLVFGMIYLYIKTPTPVMSAYKFRDNHPITSFALFKIHESIEPMISGKAASALSANLPDNCDKAFNLFFIHSLAPPPFPSPALVLPDAVVVDTVGPPNKTFFKNPIAIPTAVI